MNDGSSEATPGQELHQTPVSNDRNARLSDLAGVFVTFLGRALEDVQQQKTYWETRSFSELLRVVAGSPEFGNIQNLLVDHGHLSGGETLSRAELRRADLWLSQVTLDHIPSARVGWAELLLAGVTSPELVGIGGPVLSSQALVALERIVEARRDAQTMGQDLISFDAEAFLAKPANRSYRGSRNAVDFDAEIDRAAPAPVMLPMFTEGLSALRRPGALTLGDWLEATQDAALAGSLTHWLWDDETYRRNRAVADRDLADSAPEGLGYLDFLAVGDPVSASPHPLFCHHAYRTLNGDRASGVTAAFRHFVEVGQGEGLRTSALFDPAFYLSHLPQAAMQVAAGLFASPLEHCVRVGLAAGYAFCPDFDRHFYLTTHPDVSQAIAEGSVPSAEWHYVFHGAREGRPPNPFFNPWYYVQRYPVVAEEMPRLGIASSLEHFVLLGQARGWSVNPPLAARTVAPDDARALFEKRGRRAYGEIIDGGITIPVAQTPRLSIIVPVSNQADLTAGFLKSAAFAMETLRSRRKIETEIIVIDNGSQDHTDTLLAALPAVHVVKQRTAFSFPVAINAGVAIARGDTLLVVNNDIEFQPDALDRIFAVLDDDPSIGVVGAKVVLPNETLQEVGVTLDRLGNTHGIGRGTDAFRVRNNRRVTVDYASGCFIAFRRTDFDALSGFDEGYSPGYYEDVDFAMRMRRDLNKVTVVDTGLAITHYENASFAKGRPSTVNMAGAIRNRLRLQTAHASAFQTMKPVRAPERATVARQVLFGKIRVLVVEDMIPTARLGSSFGRQEAILDAFTALGITFDILASTASPLVDNYKDPRVQIFRGWMPGQSLEDVLYRHAADYSHLWLCHAATLTRHAAAVAQAKAGSELQVICDIEAMASQEAIERMRLATGPVAEDTVLSALAYELTHSMDVDRWVTVDSHDRTIVERMGLGPVSEIGHAPRALDTTGSKRPLTERDRILFVGVVPDRASTSYDAVEWVLSEVWPRLAGIEQAKLTVVGTWDERLARSFEQRFADRIEMLGTVDDAHLAEIYSRTRVALAPDRFTAGRTAKVAEAVLAGVPTVMTDHVAGRLGLANDKAIAWAPRDDDGRAFAEWLSRLYTDDKAWLTQLKKQCSVIVAEAEPADIVSQVRAALISGEGPS